MILADADRTELAVERGVGRSDRAQQLIERLDLAPAAIAYFSGSLLDGMGDATSDHDVYVLTSYEDIFARRDKFERERNYQQQRHGAGLIYLEIDGAAYDVEFHQRSKIEEMIASLNEYRRRDAIDSFTSFDSLGRYERVEAQSLLHRFRIGAPFHNREAFAALRSGFPDGAFQRWQAEHFVEAAGDFIKGVRRSLHEGDPQNAYLKLTRLYDALADLALANAGQSLDRWKWRLPKLRRFAAPALLDAYLDVQLCRDQGDLHGFCTTALARAVELLARLRGGAIDG